MISRLIFSAFMGLLVFLIGTLFDRSPNNQYAGLAGLITFVLVFLSREVAIG